MRRLLLLLLAGFATAPLPSAWAIDEPLSLVVLTSIGAGYEPAPADRQLPDGELPDALLASFIPTGLLDGDLETYARSFVDEEGNAVVLLAFRPEEALAADAVLAGGRSAAEEQGLTEFDASEVPDSIGFTGTSGGAEITYVQFVRANTMFLVTGAAEISQDEYVRIASEQYEAAPATSDAQQEASSDKAALYATIVGGAIGGALYAVWMRRRKARKASDGGTPASPTQA